MMRVDEGSYEGSYEGRWGRGVQIRDTWEGGYMQYWST